MAKDDDDNNNNNNNNHNNNNKPFKLYTFVFIGNELMQRQNEDIANKIPISHIYRQIPQISLHMRQFQWLPRACGGIAKRYAGA